MKTHDTPSAATDNALRLARHLLVLGVWGALGAASVTCVNGCNSHPQPDFPAEALPAEALLQPETVEVYYDEEDLDETRADEDMVQAEQALVGDPAKLLEPMRRGLYTSNSMIRNGVVILREIVRVGQFRPEASVRDSRWVWTIEGVRRFTQLTIARDLEEPGRFNYLLAVRPANDDAAPMVSMLQGFFRPGPSFTGPQGRTRQSGSGLLMFNYTAINAGKLGDRESGAGAVGFRVTPLKRNLNVLFKDFSPRRSDQEINSRFAFEGRADGSGMFNFGYMGDFIQNVPGDETVRQTVRWDQSRSGRGHATITTQPNPDQPFTIDECWDSSLEQTFVQSTPEVPEFAADGAEEDCPFGERPQLGDLTPVGEGDAPEIPEE